MQNQIIETQYSLNLEALLKKIKIIYIYEYK